VLLVAYRRLIYAKEGKREKRREEREEEREKKKEKKNRCPMK
jgi:hypothetical protein